MSQIYQNSVFLIEVDKIKPNPFQPRTEFDLERLADLADSIRQYGVLQPLVVTRKEVAKPDGGLAVEYELIAGERRLRASKLAGLSKVPVVIRVGAESDKEKLELAIIENLQREDLNPVERAKAFYKLAEDFKFKHADIARKVGKSREYVSNSLRLLSLPDFIVQALTEGKISEGHARPLMMLNGKLDEQATLFKEILFKKLTVRQAESLARQVVQDKIRRRVENLAPELRALEEELAESLGTRVHIEKRETGGKLTIDFFSEEDLRNLLDVIGQRKSPTPTLPGGEGEASNPISVISHQVEINRPGQNPTENSLLAGSGEVGGESSEQPKVFQTQDVSNLLISQSLETDQSQNQNSNQSQNNSEQQIQDSNKDDDLYTVPEFGV